MRDRISSALVLLALVSAGLHAQAPSTDIFVLPVEDAAVGAAIRVTDRDGYDNQPSFLPDGDTVIYSSRRGNQVDLYGVGLPDGRAGE